MRRTTTLLVLCLALTMMGGCGRGGGLPMVAVRGTVTCGGEPVDMGEIRFVPIEGTPGPLSAGIIQAGQYRIDARGGVPAGRHRVEIVAQRRTGRQVMGHTGTEPGMIDETESAGSPEYAGEQSPLIAEVSRSNTRFDFDLPEE